MAAATTQQSVKPVTAMIQILETIKAHLKTTDIPMQQVMTLAYIADRGQIPMADLIELTGVSQSSVSRNIATLGIGLTPMQPGYGLVEAFEDPFYRKRKLVQLTARGKELFKAIEKNTARYLRSAA